MNVSIIGSTGVGKGTQVDRVVVKYDLVPISIGEVIAFPKTASGADPMTGAPAPLEPRQLRELGLGGAARS